MCGAESATGCAPAPARASRVRRRPGRCWQCGDPLGQGDRHLFCSRCSAEGSPLPRDSEPEDRVPPAGSHTTISVEPRPPTPPPDRGGDPRPLGAILHLIQPPPPLSAGATTDERRAYALEMRLTLYRRRTGLDRPTLRENLRRLAAARRSVECAFCGRISRAVDCRIRYAAELNASQTESTGICCRACRRAFRSKRKPGPRGSGCTAPSAPGLFGEHRGEPPGKGGDG